MMMKQLVIIIAVFRVISCCVCSVAPVTSDLCCQILICCSGLKAETASRCSERKEERGERVQGERSGLLSCQRLFKKGILSFTSKQLRRLSSEDSALKTQLRRLSSEDSAPKTQLRRLSSKTQL
ncbi:hypothetical protein KUCAC02_017864 [Chaenocephalus aceratus]|nr:hypothetical protein KUCAC02_017864 [Chaenocephalus aceratus]